MDKIYCSSEREPVNECTTPFLNLCLFSLTIQIKSSSQFLLCKYIGKLNLLAQSKCKGNALLN